MDITTLSLAKKYANKIAAGITAARVEGSSIILTLVDGTEAICQLPAPKDGISVIDLSIDTDGSLLCHMSDGTTIDAGYVPTVDPDLTNYYTKEEIDKELKDHEYKLPIASSDTLGGIKIGENLSIDENGIVSASGGEIKFYSIYLDTTLSQNSTLYLHTIPSPYNTELKEFISNVMTECANKNYNSILILIRFKCTNSIQQVPYLLLAFDSAYKISSANNNYHVVSIGNEVLQNRIFYKYRIDINGTWSDNVFIVSTIIGNRDKHEFISTETGLTKTNTTSFTPTSDYNPATKKYVDDAITTAITTSLEGSY